VTTLDDNTVFSKYEAEAAQGARPADLLVASAPASWVQAEQNGVSANFTPAGLSAFPSWVNQGSGVFVMSAEPALLVYNPKLLTPSEVPRTWAQLAADAKADPGKYKLVSYPISNPLNYGGIYAPQKAGPIPLGNDCSVLPATTGPCPEGGIQTNGDFLTQASQAQGQLWTSTSTQIAQTYTRANAEIHMGEVYWVVGTRSFDTTGKFTLTSQGYVSPEHEDLSMPAMVGTPSSGGKAITLFTLTGNGGPTGADHGGFYPSTAFGRLTSTSGSLLNSTINIADLGKSPQDGFSEYQFFPGATRPRWGDYSWGLFVPGTGGRIYFANEYIQYPNCTGKDFNPNAIPTCGGTRDGRANWGTSVNYVVP